MATKLEENFVKKHIKGNQVFEFGNAPGKFTEEIAGDYNVTAIDLYDAEHTNGYKVIKGDLLDTDIEEKFDTVICLSSFEHCGIETLNFLPGNEPNALWDRPVAIKLVSMVNEGGRLVITAPFGNSDVFFVDKDGNNGTADEIPKPAWGFRTFRVDQIADMFSPLELTEAKVYGFVEGNYFEETSWKEISVDDYTKYNNKHRGLLCCVLEKGSN